MPLREANVSTLKTLLWASQFGYHSLEVSHDFAGREKFLKTLLVDETTKLFSKLNPESSSRLFFLLLLNVLELRNSIVTLWSHIFAPLLSFGRHAVPYAAALILADSLYPGRPDWPPIVSKLSAILHQRLYSPLR